MPAVTQFTTGDVQQTATNTVGASTVSLRGLGPNRNLVLINGRRGDADRSRDGRRHELDSRVGAIQRVEVISGGASAVYGADAVGGVVNFILKDNYEGASVDVRFGDTEHGGDQTTTISGLFGVNSADDRGNVMLGIERDTRSKQFTWQRDWRIEDLANPTTAGGGFAFGSATWFHNEPGGDKPNPNFQAGSAVSANNPSSCRTTIPNPVRRGFPGCRRELDGHRNNPAQSVRQTTIFPDDGCPFPNRCADSGRPAASISNNLAASRFRINRDGTVFSGLADATALSSGAYKFNGPVYNDNSTDAKAAATSTAASRAYRCS